MAEPSGVVERVAVGVEDPPWGTRFPIRHPMEVTAVADDDEDDEDDDDDEDATIARSGLGKFVSPVAELEAAKEVDVRRKAVASYEVVRQDNVPDSPEVVGTQCARWIVKRIGFAIEVALASVDIEFDTSEVSVVAADSVENSAVGNEGVTVEEEVVALC